jgi:hypothetical protein
MGKLSFWSDAVGPEYDDLAKKFPQATAFLVARLAQVVRLGPKEAVSDEIPGEPQYQCFECKPVCVIYSASSDEADANVEVLTFGNLGLETFNAVLRRAKSRHP